MDCGENAIRAANLRLTRDDLTLDSYHDYRELPRLFKRGGFGTICLTVQAVTILSTIFTAFSISYELCVLFYKALFMNYCDLCCKLRRLSLLM